MEAWAMPTDDDRREVARRLRDKKAECEERGYPWMCDDLILALGYDHDYEAGDEIFDRLADLIDPGESGQNLDKNRDTVQIESPAVQKAPECDRDALLALADEMKEKVLVYDRLGLRVPTRDVMGYSRRIREALGASE